jgi:superfamily II DNA/RNA helicase
LFSLICSLKSQAAIVFCNHRDAAERISDTLNEKEYTYYHGGMDQDERERALIQFRNGKCKLFNHHRLSCSRLDIPEMNHVIHYHLPSKETSSRIEMVIMTASGTIRHCT